METERRIPIFTGFSIEISRDGRPLSHGLEEAHVIASVESWLRASKNHPDRPTVEQWLQLKMAADEEDSRVQAIRKKRQDAHAEVDKHIPKVLGPEFKKEVRRMILEKRGIPDENKE
jgi:macrodomain Ter protein organizer (MatP/YcbG family)